MNIPPMPSITALAYELAHKAMLEGWDIKIDMNKGTVTHKIHCKPPIPDADPVGSCLKNEKTGYEIALRRTNHPSIGGGVNALEQFALAVLEESRNEMTDLDGGWPQDKAEELGLLVRVAVTEPCGTYCHCAEYGDFPQDCLQYSAAVRKEVATTVPNE